MSIWLTQQDGKCMTDKIVAIIQARTSSARLPRKVLMDLYGKPMLQRVVERVLLSQLVSKVVVATSLDDSDVVIEELCQEIGVDCFRGDLDDVLARYYYAAKLYNADHIVRITADCPLIDFIIIDSTISLHLKSANQYTSNCVPPSFPDGLDVEVMTRKCLQDAFDNALLPSQREHVTLYVNQQLERFKTGVLLSEKDYSPMRWTVDQIEDLEFVRFVYAKLEGNRTAFQLEDVLDLQRKYPKLAQLNMHIQRNEGMQKSMDLDSKTTYYR